MNEITIYTDGSCYPNPGPGGWAAIIMYEDREETVLGAQPDTTNNRMELTAVIGALKSVEGFSNIILYTDSNYVRLGITEWMPKWVLRDWQTSTNKAVANKDLWVVLNEEALKHKIDWRWVKGHNTDEHNIRVDELARRARLGYW